MINAKLPPYQRKRTVSTSSDQNMSSINSTTMELPCGTIPLGHQVGGHTFQNGTDAIGMLKDQTDGSILKPATKILCGAREIKFYEQLQEENAFSFLSDIKNLVPEYRGTVRLRVGGKSIEFLKLTDITQGMIEPCVIDIKIGKRTWDPLASQEKINAEETKYEACKNNLGFCIPGFQVYCLTTGRIRRYGKEYGKKLNETTIQDAFKLFLNADYGLSRSLLMQILSELWSIQKWARTQKSIRLYSSSLLIAYDARRLKETIMSSKKSSNGSVSNTNGGTTTPIVYNHIETNGKLSSENVQVFKKLQRCHSAQNNYDEDLKTIQENYVFMLDNLIDTNRKNSVWAFVKMIDFAHVFPAEDNSIDENFLFGIEHLVRMFEQFLKECD